MLNDWKRNNQITNYWITNQSNVVMYQGSEYKKRGGACFVIVQSFLLQALQQSSSLDAWLDKFHIGDIKESLELESERDNMEKIANKLGQMIKSKDQEIQKEKASQNKRKIETLMEEKSQLLEVREKVLDLLESKLIIEESSKDMQQFDSAQIVNLIKTLADGAYEIRLLKKNKTGHSLGIVKTKDSFKNSIFYFMDPSTISFRGGVEILAKVQLLLERYKKRKENDYKKVKIVKWSRYSKCF